jgi:hypothetical protein
LSIVDAPVSFNAHGLLYSNGQMYLSLTNLVGQGPVVIDASTNLRQWTPIFTNPSAFGNLLYIDSNAGSYPHRFYRATTP